MHHLFLKKLAILMTVLATPVCFAKPLNLYDQPKTDAKIIGTIESSAGIIPIFTTKEGDFIKVGDPKNGNVGWLKQQELKSLKGIKYSQQMIYTSTPLHSFSVIHYDNHQLTNDEVAMIKRLEEKQVTMQKHMRELMEEMYSNFPVMFPVMIYPDHVSKLVKNEAQSNTQKQDADAKSKVAQNINTQNPQKKN